MSRTLTVREYGRSEAVRLDQSQRRMLRAVLAGRGGGDGVRIEPAEVDGHFTIQPQDQVGVVRVGDLTIELRPKVGVAQVLFMLSYALDPTFWREPLVAVDEDATLAEALLLLFERSCERALQRGPLHGYRGYDEALTTVRGRVRFADQIRARPGLLLPVEVTYDEHTPDIVENQLLLAGVEVLGRLRLRDDASLRRLDVLRRRLPGVSLVPWGREPPEPLWSRLNEHYRPAVSLARLIISSSGLAASVGVHQVNSFVVRMNVVFEEFVRVALREALGLSRTSFPAAGRPRSLHLDTACVVRLEPDLSWWEDGACRFVGDCKYKVADKKAQNADVYQMLAYLTRLELQDGLLVYAKGEREPVDIHVRGVAKQVLVRTLDLSAEPGQILSQVRTVAGLVRRLADSAPQAV